MLHVRITLYGHQTARRLICYRVAAPGFITKPFQQLILPALGANAQAGVLAWEQWGNSPGATAAGRQALSTGVCLRLVGEFSDREREAWSLYRAFTGLQNVS